MNPNGAGENPTNPVGTAPAASVEPVNPLNNLEGVVAAAKEVAAVGSTPVNTAEPVPTAAQEATDVKSPTSDFLRQFGDRVGPVQPPVSEGLASASAVADPILTDIKPPVAETTVPVSPLPDATVANLSPEKTPKPEQNLNEKAMQEIKDILAKYELTEKKPAETTV